MVRVILGWITKHTSLNVLFIYKNWNQICDNQIKQINKALHATHLRLDQENQKENGVS